MFFTKKSVLIGALIASVLGNIGLYFYFKQTDSVAATQNITTENNEIEISAPIVESPISIPSPKIKNKAPLAWDWNGIDTSKIYFPKDFLWGVGTSAHQVEGDCTNNDWAAWEPTQSFEPTGNACEHWKNYKHDIQLIKQLGVQSYRFSIEWSKVEPKEGSFNPMALKHYEDVCKELVKNGIKPVITLHHYTNPIWFIQKGGFERIENAKYFVRFCTKVFEQLNPYVHLWLTFNSPTSYVARAYHAKMAPPGVENMQLMQEVLKNMLEAHVQTYHALKKLPHGKEARIGICHNIYQVEPKNFWDKAGCSTAHSLFNENVYQFFKTGNFKASVPFKVSLSYSNPKAKNALDFIGLNYYSHGLMNGFNIEPYPGEIKTQSLIYTVYAEGLYRALQELTKELAKPLNIPIYVTENGIATNNEKDRETFFKHYLFALSYARSVGCPVKGYMVWSLMDNYEWGTYDTRYGIYSVDYATQERGKKPKKGAEYFVNTVKKFSK